MITPIDEVIYDHSLACTEDEAVLKLLGWMQGSERLRYLQVTLDGLEIEQLPHLYKLPTTLAEFFSGEREDARNRLRSAIVSGDSSAASKWEEVVEYWDDINARSMDFRIAIANELEQQPSQLKIDEKLTQETGVRHITLISLDRWAQLTYEITIIETAKDRKADNLPTSSEGARNKQSEQENVIEDTIRQQGHDPRSLPRANAGKAGVKAAVRKILVKKHPLFDTEVIFNKAWERLSAEEHIGYTEYPPK